MADWDEIKRLAADFQRTQTSDTLQRISERNCIDIVKKLTELNLIELIYTCDGKEFITPAHLAKEIGDEIYANGGRMHLHDLASNLNVDYQHVEDKAKELAKEHPGEYSLILGQVIHSAYKITLGKQIYDTMLTTGQLSIADFAKSLDLPSEFLFTIVKELLPRVMDDFVVSQDERTYYTADMMHRYKSIVAGTLSAISRPTSIASIMKRLDMSERIFMPIVDGLIKEGRIDATVENRQFIPSVHAREQCEWIDRFYSSNSYIEYDVLTRMDIKQPKSFLKKRFQDGTPLKTCFVGPALVSQIESHIEESIATNSWIDISTIVPPCIESGDIEYLLQEIFQKNKQFKASCLVFNQTNVCSLGFVATCKGSLEKSMQTVAQEHLKQGRLSDYFLGRKQIETPRKPVQSKEKENESDEVVKEKPKETKGDEEKGQPPNIDHEVQATSKGAKREKKDKKPKDDAGDMDESDEDLTTKKSKSRKSGGGAQGREIKQKSVKKKYLAGKANQKADVSDEEMAPSKAPRSSKGRAARRGLSPERPSEDTSLKSVKQRASSPKREPLIFMRTEEMIQKLKQQTQDSGDCSDEMFKSIADLVEKDLNKAYEVRAKQVLDEFLKLQVENEDDSSKTPDIEVIE